MSKWKNKSMMVVWVNEWSINEGWKINEWRINEWRINEWSMMN